MIWRRLAGDHPLGATISGGVGAVGGKILAATQALPDVVQAMVLWCAAIATIGAACNIIFGAARHICRGIRWLRGKSE